MTLPKNVVATVQRMRCMEPIPHGLNDLYTCLMLKDAEIDRLRCDADDYRAAMGDVVSRLAAANALLRTIAAYTPPDHECRRGCPKETCEACKLANYLQGASDE